MKSIAYVIPYFGVLPKGFQLWLLSCETNSTIHWLLFTDDNTPYNYPENVKVTYCTFTEFKNKLQSNWDFQIVLDRPYKICDFRPAFGEIFSEELKNYDYWGYCDIDLMWGNIRKYITEDIFSKYERIGFQGHSTLFKNTKTVNERYKTILDGVPTYKEIFSDKKSYLFDEDIISQIYDRLNIDYYKETVFAHLHKYEYNFFLEHLPEGDNYKNINQIFIWKNGSVIRMYVHNNRIYEEEFMYLHFFCRPMTYHINQYSIDKTYIIYPDTVTDKNVKIDAAYIMNKSKKRRLIYYAKSIYLNRHKLTREKITANIKRMVKYKKSLKKTD